MAQGSEYGDVKAVFRMNVLLLYLNKVIPWGFSITVTHSACRVPIVSRQLSRCKSPYKHSLCMDGYTYG